MAKPGLLYQKYCPGCRPARVGASVRAMVQGSFGGWHRLQKRVCQEGDEQLPLPSPASARLELWVARWTISIWLLGGAVQPGIRLLAGAVGTRPQRSTA